ncbi:MAG TPA: hypothetical protein VLK85_20370 [Ramlibacter sp.]|nr:hypothetical protein [Ramlibacter sp.]
MTADLALSNAQYGFLAGAGWVLSFGVAGATRPLTTVLLATDIPWPLPGQ